MADHGVAAEDQATIVDKYQLGVVIDPLQDDENKEGMLVFPYLTKHGVRSVKFRNLGDFGGKNLYPDGIKHRVYNPVAYFEAGPTIGIAEGEMDAIIATEYLGVPSIGIPGTESWKPNRNIWAPVFKNFDRVIIFTDGDAINPNTGVRPGEELGKEIASSLGWRAKVVACPEGEDVSSMVASGRENELLEKMKEEDEDDEDS